MSKAHDIEAMFNLVNAPELDSNQQREALEDIAHEVPALLAFAKDVRDALEHGEDILNHGAEISSDFPNLVAALRTALNKLEES